MGAMIGRVIGAIQNPNGTTNMKYVGEELARPDFWHRLPSSEQQVFWRETALSVPEVDFEVGQPELQCTVLGALQSTNV